MTSSVVQNKKDEISRKQPDTGHTHKASGISRVRPDLAVDLDQALHDDRRNLLAGQSILEAVTEENGERKRFAKLVGTGGWTGGLGEH